MTLIVYYLLSDCVINNDRQRYTSVDSNCSFSSTIEKHYILTNKNFVVEKQYLNNTKNGPIRAWNNVFTASVMVNPAATARSSPVMAGTGSDQTENTFSPPVKVISTFNVIVMISGH